MAADISQMPKDLAKRAVKIEKAVDKGAKDSRLAGAKVAKAEHLDVIVGDGGPVLSRVRSGKGAKVGARFDLTATSAIMRATGSLPLLANKIGAHKIPKAGSSKLLSIPGTGVRRSVNHPGSPGKDTWNRGRERAQPKVTKIIRKTVDTEVLKSFKGG